YERNRRIEISVALKDANVRKLIEQYMQNVDAAGGGAAATGAAGGAATAPDGSNPRPAEPAP
ncbi:MAG TPA: hypothetical protein VNN80_07720, partial [Polyangiaceae bacterium]|nr:hypothetical protein [Polyangiaceae bacterium]